MQTRERDELPAVAQLAQTLDIRLLLRARHGSLPVERGREVVSEFLLRVHGVHALGELLGLLEIGEFALHPDGVCVGTVRDGAVDGAFAAALESVVSLSCSWRVPVPWDVDTGDALGDGAGFGVALAFDVMEEFGGEFFLVDVYARVDGVDYGVVEELEACLGGPGVFDGLELGAVLAGSFGGDHEVVERLEGWVSGA